MIETIKGRYGSVLNRIYSGTKTQIDKQIQQKVKKTIKQGLARHKK